MLVVSALAVASLSRLDHVYSLDQLDYHEKAVRLSREFRSSFVTAAGGVVQSLRHDDHNDLAAVPLAVWVSIFGERRQPFVLGVLLLYAVPASALFAVLMCSAYRRFCGRPPPSWLAAGWLLTPWLIGAFWTPTILGRVGVGGLGFIFAAVGLHLRHSIEAQERWEPLAVGGLLAGAVLFQRWYIFAAVGVLAAIAAQSLLALLRRERPGERSKILAGFLLLMLSLAVVSMPFALIVTRRIQHTAYLDIFSDFHHAGSVMYLWGNPWSVAERLGLPSLLVVLAALAWGIVQRQWRSFLAATAVAGAVSLALFSRIQAPGVHHTLVWVGVESIVLGVGLAQLSTLPRTTSRIVAAASVVMLSTSVVAVLFSSCGRDAGPDRAWWCSLAPSLTVGDFLPKNRDVVMAAVDFLKTNIPSGSSIAFLSHGLSLNDDALRNIRFSVPGCDLATRYRILPTRRLRPDRGIPYFVLRVDYVVVVDPLAFRDPLRNSVSWIPAAWLFRRNSPLAGCFRTVAGPAALPDGCTITAFRMRKGMDARAREILADELAAAFAVHGRPGRDP